MDPVFNSTEMARYQRHFALPGFGTAGQDRLRQSTVLVIGAGGLGCPALLYLAAAGVGRIVLVDPDVVETSNLQRQVLFTLADVGEAKVVAAARRLTALNPLVRIDARRERFSRANALAMVADCDVVVDGSDNFSTRYLVNDACVMGEKPFVYGAVQAFEGQLSVFNWRGGPTYRCLFPEPPPPGTVPNCAEGGVLGVLPGLIGTGQACETIKLLAGIGEPLSGRLLLWDALTMATHVVALAADPRSRPVRELPPEGYGETCAGPEEPPAEIDSNELRAALARTPALQLIDVREGWERAMGAINPSLHIPLGALERGLAGSALATLDPRAPTIVYCAAGVRSLRAAQILRERHDFRAPTSLRGGYQIWARES